MKCKKKEFMDPPPTRTPQIQLAGWRLPFAAVTPRAAIEWAAPSGQQQPWDEAPGGPQPAGQAARAECRIGRTPQPLVAALGSTGQGRGHPEVHAVRARLLLADAYDKLADVLVAGRAPEAATWGEDLIRAMRRPLADAEEPTIEGYVADVQQLVGALPLLGADPAGQLATQCRLAAYAHRRGLCPVGLRRSGLFASLSAYESPAPAAPPAAAAATPGSLTARGHGPASPRLGTPDPWQAARFTRLEPRIAPTFAPAGTQFRLSGSAFERLFLSEGPLAVRLDPQPQPPPGTAPPPDAPAAFVSDSEIAFTIGPTGGEYPPGMAEVVLVATRTGRLLHSRHFVRLYGPPRCRWAPCPPGLVFRLGPGEAQQRDVRLGPGAQLFAEAPPGGAGGPSAPGGLLPGVRFEVPPWELHCPAQWPLWVSLSGRPEHFVDTGLAFTYCAPQFTAVRPESVAPFGVTALRIQGARLADLVRCGGRGRVGAVLDISPPEARPKGVTSPVSLSVQGAGELIGQVVTRDGRPLLCGGNPGTEPGAPLPTGAEVKIAVGEGPAARLLPTGLRVAFAGLPRCRWLTAPSTSPRVSGRPASRALAPGGAGVDEVTRYGWTDRATELCLALAQQDAQPGARIRMVGFQAPPWGVAELVHLEMAALLDPAAAPAVPGPVRWVDTGLRFGYVQPRFGQIEPPLAPAFCNTTFIITDPPRASTSCSPKAAAREGFEGLHQLGQPVAQVGAHTDGVPTTCLDDGRLSFTLTPAEAAAAMPRGVEGPDTAEVRLRVAGRDLPTGCRVALYQAPVCRWPTAAEEAAVSSSRGRLCGCGGCAQGQGPLGPHCSGRDEAGNPAALHDEERPMAVRIEGRTGPQPPPAIRTGLTVTYVLPRFARISRVLPCACPTSVALAGSGFTRLFCYAAAAAAGSSSPMIQQIGDSGPIAIFCHAAGPSVLFGRLIGLPFPFMADPPRDSADL
ncbi:hypothetical protein PAPYR_6793 [Paratrimastix pyriformis]|uniref:Uncharacterized protein n=1 Tax=Paratrimastix pyriformis TaxID=342808 RepID=A0ABQ8UFW0_9EUKA|nr:hypothetical protein PAPYR_6793 [Paratrimastix pyriformis]